MLFRSVHHFPLLNVPTCGSDSETIPASAEHTHVDQLYFAICPFAQDKDAFPKELTVGSLSEVKRLAGVLQLLPFLSQ